MNYMKKRHRVKIKKNETAEKTKNWKYQELADTVREKECGVHGGTWRTKHYRLYINCYGVQILRVTALSHGP
jgi:hypothetical protein